MAAIRAGQNIRSLFCSLIAKSGPSPWQQCQAAGFATATSAAVNVTPSNLHAAVAGSGYVQSWAEASVNPFQLVEQELSVVSQRLQHSVQTSIPILKQAAEYFFRSGIEGKRLRPSLCLLMSSALSPTVASAEFLTVDTRPPGQHVPELRRRQQRIAEIAELIHVASLLHDDVIDDAETRRGVPSLNGLMGNKTAILAGDFLLARASVSLAALRDTRIVELLSQVLEHLVSGEVMQMTAGEEQLLDMEHYLQKSYCKTASLMANSSRAIAVLSGHADDVCDLAWNYGRHLGLAFQIVDDVLDLTASSSMLGKPALNDLKSGLSTAPVLFAAQEHSELRPLILRRFKRDGDVALAMQYIGQSSGIRRAQALAAEHCGLAADMVRRFPPATSDHSAICRAALIRITEKVLNRSK